MGRSIPEVSVKLERVPSPIGEALLVTNEQGALVALDWADRRERLETLLARYQGSAELEEHEEDPSAAAQASAAFFAGELAAVDQVAVDPGGTPFQQEVWAALRQIPVGQTTTYSELARQLGRPDAVRAVGAANGANPISVVVPCHRVIGAGGELRGYAGGLERKRWLITHEGAAVPATQESLF